MTSLHPVFSTQLMIDVFRLLNGRMSPLALSDIRGITGANPSSLSRAIHALEAATYVTIARRGRKAYLAPTDRGSDAYARFSPSMTKIERDGAYCRATVPTAGSADQ